MTFEEYLLRGALGALAASALWSALLVPALLVEALSAGRWRPARALGCPRRWRRRAVATTVWTLTGLGLLAVTPAPAGARPDAATPAGAGHPLIGLPLPDPPRDDHPAARPSSAPEPRPSPRSGARLGPRTAADPSANTAPAAMPVRLPARRTPARSRPIVPGDTLWGIASRHLRGFGEPSDAQIATYVMRLHAANRDVLGPDPDVIHPGPRLRLPPVPRRNR